MYSWPVASLLCHAWPAKWYIGLTQEIHHPAYLFNNHAFFQPSILLRFHCFFTFIDQPWSWSWSYSRTSIIWINWQIEGLYYIYKCTLKPYVIVQIDIDFYLDRIIIVCVFWYVFKGRSDVEKYSMSINIKFLMFNTKGNKIKSVNKWIKPPLGAIEYKIGERTTTLY